jgi:hypothetical protein
MSALARTPDARFEVAHKDKYISGIGFFGTREQLFYYLLICFDVM